jgi:aspartyl-tRNA(Asn)/glutamyl-tRNA(Gln) amidotransferase subunit A
MTLLSKSHPSSRERLEECLSRIADRNGEGARTCLTVYTRAARDAADAADARAHAGISLGPLDGAIVSLKDLFDVAGEPTRAGSKILADAPPAKADAPVVHRLRAAGAVIVVKTNMSEFAFSGVGVNPHYGTPGNPHDRSRVPGGSSSGAAVAVTDGFAEISIGTDTAGSTRIPAGLCGIAGFKPTTARVPTKGAFPLSFTLDSIGPLAKSVAECAAADAAMAGEDAWPLEAAALAGLRIGIAQGLPLTDCDATVTTRFAFALGALERARVRLSDEPMPLFDEPARVQAKASLSSVESYFVHRDRLEERGAEYDPIVRARIEMGAAVPAADYIAVLRRRSDLVGAMDARLAHLDAFVMPTTPIVAPRKDEVATFETFMPKNLLLLRNTGLANFFDLCAISLPIPGDGLPVGLMLVARRGEDRRLLRIAAAAERVLAR